MTTLEGSSSHIKHQPQQIENLSPLAVGDQKLNRHLGFFSGTMMNGIIMIHYLYCAY